jgi:outer membrane protein
MSFFMAMKTEYQFLKLFVNRFILTGVLYFLPGVALGQGALTLEDCLRLAMQNSRQIKISELSIQQAQERIGEARAQQIPAFTLAGTYTHFGKVSSFSIPMGPTTRTFQFGIPDRANLDAKLQWSLFTWGRIGSSISLSRLGKELSITKRKSDLSQTIYQVMQAFYSVLLNEKIIQLHTENLHRAESLWQITQKRFVAGGIPKLEVLRAEVQVKNTESTLEEARGNLKKSQLFLAKQLGNSQSDYQLAGQLQYLPVVIVVDEIVEKALKVRSDFQTLELQQDISRQQVKLAYSSNKPNLSLFSGYNVQNGFDPMNPERFISNWNVGLQLSFPIFDGFATVHKTNQAKIESRKTTLQKEELQDLVTLQIQQAVTTLEQAALKIISQEKNIDLAEEALRVTTDQFQQGIVSSLDVLNAQQTLAQSEMMYTQALFNHIMAKIEISRAMEDFSWFALDLQSGDGIQE